MTEMHLRVWKVWSAILFTISVSSPQYAVAQETIQQAIWKEPDGSLQDLSQTFTNGQTFGVSWNSYDSTQYVDTSQNLVDLWVTGFDFNVNPFSQRLLENINMTQQGTYAWTIKIPSSNLALSAKYVLRFKLPSKTFTTSTGELSSPGFLVIASAASSISSTSSRSSVSSVLPTSVSSASVSVTSSSSSSPTGPVKVSSGLSSGAKAGIGIGATIGALSLIGFIAFIRHRIRKSSTLSDEAAGQNLSYHGIEKSNVRESDVRVVQPIEMPADGQCVASELPAR